MKKGVLFLSTIVHKYGGTSMGSIEKIKSVAKKVILEKEKGNDVVVVVSAMGKTTNKLVDLAKEIDTNPDKREFDMLLSYLYQYCLFHFLHEHLLFLFQLDIL